MIMIVITAGLLDDSNSLCFCYVSIHLHKHTYFNLGYLDRNDIAGAGKAAVRLKYLTTVTVTCPMPVHSVLLLMDSTLFCVLFS